MRRRLGAGGFGEVLEAEDQARGQPVALKLLRAPSPDARARFLREARRTAQLDHPHLVRVQDHGEGSDGTLWIAYQLLPGPDLVGARQRAAPGAPEVREWGQDLASAVARLHDAGMIHRDIKPANVLLDAGGRPVLCDLGLVRDLAPRDGTMRTAEGMVIGTPAYMPPEGLRGEPIGTAADLFALAGTLGYCWWGQPPWGAEDLRGVLAALPGGPAPLPLAARREDPGLADALARALDPDPGARGTLEDLRAALARPAPAPGRPPAGTQVAGEPPQATRQLPAAASPGTPRPTPTPTSPRTPSPVPASPLASPPEAASPSPPARPLGPALAALALALAMAWFSGLGPEATRPGATPRASAPAPATGPEVPTRTPAPGDPAAARAEAISAELQAAIAAMHACLGRAPPEDDPWRVPDLPGEEIDPALQEGRLPACLEPLLQALARYLSAHPSPRPARVLRIAGRLQANAFLWTRPPAPVGPRGGFRSPSMLTDIQRGQARLRDDLSQALITLGEARADRPLRTTLAGALLAEGFDHPDALAWIDTLAVALEAEDREPRPAGHDEDPASDPEDAHAEGLPEAREALLRCITGRLRRREVPCSAQGRWLEAASRAGLALPDDRATLQVHAVLRVAEGCPEAVSARAWATVGPALRAWGRGLAEDRPRPRFVQDHTSLADLAARALAHPAPRDADAARGREDATEGLRTFLGVLRDRSQAGEVLPRPTGPPLRALWLARRNLATFLARQGGLPGPRDPDDLLVPTAEVAVRALASRTMCRRLDVLLDAAHEAVRDLPPGARPRIRARLEAVAPQLAGLLSSLAPAAAAEAWVETWQDPELGPRELGALHQAAQGEWSMVEGLVEDFLVGLEALDVADPTVRAFGQLAHALPASPLWRAASRWRARVPAP